MSGDYKAVYTKQFEQDRYANNAHTPDHAYAVHAIPEDAPSVLDVGSGRGIFLRKVKARLPKIKLKSADLSKFHDMEIPFFEVNLADPVSLRGLASQREPVVTCVGVLEHLEERHVEAAIAALRAATTNVAIITAANHVDKGYGGVDLHLTLQPAAWWQALLEKHFARVEDVHVYSHGRGFCFTCWVK